MGNYKTGVILGGIFLEREEFIQIFTEYLNSVGNTFFLKIEKLCQKISKIFKKLSLSLLSYYCRA